MDTQREPMLGEDGMSMTTKDMAIAPEAATGEAAGGGAEPMVPPPPEIEEEEEDSTSRRSLLPSDSTDSYRERWEAIHRHDLDHKTGFSHDQRLEIGTALRRSPNGSDRAPV